MADNKEGEEAAPGGNEWEDVLLTASAYAASPGPEQVDLSHYRQGDLDGAEISTAMFLSGHFVFPPSQRENLPVESEYDKINDEKVGEFDVPQLVVEEGGKSDGKCKEKLSIKKLMSDEFSGIQMFDEKANRLSVANFEKDVVLDKEKSISSSAAFPSSHHEATMDNFNTTDEGEGIDDIPLSEDHAGLLNFQKPVEGEKYVGGDFPCEAWWKRRAVSLYAQAKEANSFWSIFIAAAVMGLVIISHRWQEERWQVLHLKWRFGVSDQRMGRVLGPISQVKDVIIGGHRCGSLLRESTTTER